MKIKEGFVLRQVAGDTVVLPSGDMDINAMITLNETGAFLWQKLEQETTVDQLVAEVLKVYETDEATARTAVEGFVEKLKNYEFLA